MEIRQLRYFVALAHNLNFSRAAEELHISQPTLSQQIAEMEGEIGGPLLIRSKRLVKMTPAGEVLLEDAENLIYQFDEMISRIRQMTDTKHRTSTLNIGVDTYDDELDRVGAIYAIEELHRSTPAAEVTLKTVPYRAVATGLKHREIDVGLYTVPLDDSLDFSYRCRVLSQDKLMMVISKELFEAHPDITANEIVGEKIMFLQQGDLRWNKYFIQMIQSISPKAAYEYLDTFRTISNRVEIGMGYYVTTSRLLGFQLKPSQAALPLDEKFGAKEIAIYEADNQNPLLAAFLKLI